MKLTFEVDVPFVIPTLRFILERSEHENQRGKPFRLSCYFDRGGKLYSKALRMKSLDDLGRCGQLLAKSAAWTVELLERLIYDPERGTYSDRDPGVNAWMQGKLFFTETYDGAPAELDSEEYWPSEEATRE